MEKIEFYDFKEIEGYQLEVFNSRQEMYNRMEDIRKSNKNEVSGFVKEGSVSFALYFKTGGSQLSSEINTEVDNSWHSHPDTEIKEILFNEEDIPEDTPEEIKKNIRDIIETYNIVDQASPNKPSLMDIITILSGGRSEDLISMPGKLLRFNYILIKPGSLSEKYSSNLKRYWSELAVYSKRKLFFKKPAELRTLTILKYYKYAISEFKKIIFELGYKKMTTENFLEILTKIGLPCEVNDLVDIKNQT